MKYLQFLLLLSLSLPAFTLKQVDTPDYVQVSEQLLEHIRDHQPTQTLVSLLEEASEEELIAQLNNDTRRKVFWINVYNAFIQLQLQEKPALYEDRSQFFKEKSILIAGRELSFSNIEHDFLRRTKVIWSLGYLNKWFPHKYKRQYQVDELDYRIHFALNCGAASCPPVDIYHPQTLDQQLNTLTKSYLGQTTEYHPEAEKVTVTRLTQWFAGDFGGKRGVRKMLKAYEALPKDADKPKVAYADYDWTLELDTFVGEKEMSSK